MNLVGRDALTLPLRAAMFLRILLVILFAIGFFAIGFGCGYGVRELISRRRRAAEREKFFRRKQQKLLDELESQIPNHAAQSAEPQLGQRIGTF